jgi:hypothetical protein
VSSVVVALPGIDPDAVGVARVCPLDLERKLGRPAYHVWMVLCRIRDWGLSSGDSSVRVVHPTVHGIGVFPGFEKTNPDQVKKALKRLRKAALVKDLGWQLRDVRRGRTIVQRKVYVRQVFGRVETPKTVVKTYADLDTLAPDVAVVPAETAAWMTTATGWGGRRAGSGRRKSGLPPQGGKLVSSVPTCEEPVAKNQEYPPPKNQEYPPKGISNSTYQEGIALTSNGPPAPADISSLPEELGCIIGGRPVERRFPSFSSSLPGVPPYPGWDVVAPARLYPTRHS